MARILIVDDSEYFRETLIDFFMDAGHTVAGEAKDGAEGFEMYKSLRPDLTTMDITMPVMDGIEALRKIIEFDPEARVIMASASAQSPKVNEALILGAYEFMPKPFDNDKLLEVITEILEDIV
jgi:two-component system chemotaxis response regulator CheY